MYSESKEEQLTTAILNNDYLKLAKLIKDPEINPSMYLSRPIREAASYGFYDCVKVLISDKRVDPSAMCNESIEFAYKNNHMNIVLLLWEDERVKNSLKEDHKEIYNNLIFSNKIKLF